ncbi:MAG: gamma-glutamyl-gamma-aminobutyrate hydrolase family protein [Chloroflexi bacterium]|nr:gamma-glutamyl-gamma-aminobutyrate hydrolase family protein [Chloroflexota bacterium]
MRPLIGIPTRTLNSSEIDFHATAWTYPHALETAGGAPVLIPLRLAEDTLRAIYARLDGLLFAGGVDVHPKEFGEDTQPFCGEIMPERDAVELKLIRWALQDKKPLLGICRGIQMINVAAGGSLYQDIPAQIPNALHHSHRPGDPYDLRVHSIEIDPQSRLARAIGTQAHVNSLHHQSLKEIASGFHIVARAPDGIVEAIEADDDRFALGVQFHPEWLADQDAQMADIFQLLISNFQPSMV